ncbi:MAG: LON peptidase substrate-binding domain-containing protein, partial [Hyphomonadaceae bacterium]|nr:LON peptidase substrate-binding domain-containing protein [Hyphomonadaceae bacterium]
MSAHYKALAKRTNPDGLALFPLSGAVLLPGCDLPLNIFEPRYLNMIDDALKGERLIGMVQDLEDHGGLRDIGGLGR